MLETVKRKLNEPAPKFAEFYIEYIMKVQDQNIEAELKPVLRTNNTYTIGLLIDREYKDMR